jgi:hypothetical protein
MGCRRNRRLFANDKLYYYYYHYSKNVKCISNYKAEAVMLGQSISMVLPEVVGYKIKGKLNEMCTSTDVVLSITKV